MKWILLLWLTTTPDFPEKAYETFTNEADCNAAGRLIKGWLDNDPELRSYYPEVQWQFECRQEKEKK